MKKIGSVMAPIVPFLVALGIQIVVTLGVEILYVIWLVINAMSSGQLDYESMSDYEFIVDFIYSNMNTNFIVGLSVMTSVICLIVFAIWYRKLYKKERQETQEAKEFNWYTFTLQKVIGIVILGAGLQICLSFLLNCISMMKPEWFNSYNQLMEQLDIGNNLLATIYTAIIAPFSEEFIFRGVILKKARKALPFMWANVLQALCFGIYHMNLVQGIYAFLLGMFLGYACYKMKSVYGSILLHMSINISGILLGLINSDLLSNTIVILIILVASIAAVIYGTTVLRKDEESEFHLN